MSKQVSILAHAFDCLPGHVFVASKGEGCNLRSAVCATLRTILADKKLHRKHIKSFKLTVVVE